MKKLTFLLLLALITGLRAIAVPAYPLPISVPQPDGTLVSIKLVGDEFYHFNTTADGYTVMLNQAGAYVYAQSDGQSIIPTHVLAHDEGNRSIEELALLANTPKFLTDRAESQQASARRKAPRHIDVADFDFENFHGLVILIDFPDRQFSIGDPQSFYDTLFNTENLTSYVDAYTGRTVSCKGSVKDYFKDQSNGIFKPHFDIFGPYRSSYRSDQFTNANTQSIFRTILNKADADVNFRNYDGNHDGKVDMVAFIVAGYSAAMGNNENYLWPHESILSAARKDNIDLDRYSCSTELYGYEATPSSVHIDGIGTICHEFSHVLGLPDLYDTDDNGSGGDSHVPGYWDLMAAGNYNNEGLTPAGYSLFERYALGWANPQVIESEGTLTLQPLNVSHDGYILMSPTDLEFFAIENRQNTGWDTYLPGHGMLITRVDSTNVQAWNDNDVNCDPNHNYLELIRAAGSLRDDKASDPFPGTKNVTAIGNETMPSLKSWTGSDNQFELYDITENDGIITFSVEAAKPRYILKETFEQMPATTSTTASNVQGDFAKWSFSKVNVTAPGSSKCIGQHSAMTKLGGRLFTTTPITEAIGQASIKAFNASTTVIKYRLEYSIDGGTTWTIAKTVNGQETADISVYTITQATWNLDIKKSDSALFRITHIAGNKSAYIDDFSLYAPAKDLATGDVNGDGEVNVADVNALIDIIMSGSTDADTMSRADVNNDGEVNVADINAIIDIILS